MKTYLIRIGIAILCGVTSFSNAQSYEGSANTDIKIPMTLLYGTASGEKIIFVGIDDGSKENLSEVGIYSYDSDKVERLKMNLSGDTPIAVDAVGHFLVVRGNEGLYVFESSSLQLLSTYRPKGGFMPEVFRDIVFQNESTKDLLTLSNTGELILFNVTSKEFQLLSESGFSMIDFDPVSGKVVLWGDGEYGVKSGKNLLYGKFDEPLKYLNVKLNLETARGMAIISQNKFMIFDTTINIVNADDNSKEYSKLNVPNHSISMGNHLIQWDRYEIYAFDYEKQKLSNIYIDKKKKLMISNVIRSTASSFLVFFRDGTVREYRKVQ